MCSQLRQHKYVTSPLELSSYYDSVLKLSNHLYQLFVIALHQNSDYFYEQISEGMNSMNCIHYMPSNESAFGIGEHTDYECFTLLAQHIGSPSALEVLMDDGEWLRYPPISNTFVLDFGDVMTRMSNDRFRSAVHRAVSRQNRSRLSIAFFRHCDFDVKVRNLIDGEQDKYEPVIAGEHVLDRVTTANPPLL